MMFGSREEFRYFKCTGCGCLQIEDVPADLGRHYPSYYYSQQQRVEPAAPSGIKGMLVRWYCESAVMRPRSAWRRRLRRLLPVPTDFAEYGRYLERADLRSRDERILDVGCGSSPHRLAAFKRCGFRAVEGIDPYIAANCSYHGIPVYRRAIDQHEGRFGLVMFHHSLEHVPDPVGAVRAAAKLLRPGGTCLIRIPVVDTFFWEQYGVDWAELDAPRHLYLMAPTTVQCLAAAAGFEVSGVEFDGHGWEIAASELIRKNIPMFDMRTGVPVSNLDGYRREEMESFKAQARALNARGQGSRACFYLRRL
jgi:SAM-dependent methyltransferase